MCFSEAFGDLNQQFIGDFLCLSSHLPRMHMCTCLRESGHAFQCCGFQSAGEKKPTTINHIFEAQVSDGEHTLHTSQCSVYVCFLTEKHQKRWLKPRFYIFIFINLF